MHKMKTTNNPLLLFPTVEKMLYDLAWKFVHKYPQLEWEDAKSQAYWGFMRACKLYKPGYCKIKFSTFCYTCTWYNLKNLVMDRSGDRLCFVEMDDDLCGEAPPAHSPCLEVLNELSHDAQEIVAMLLETPKEVLEVAGTPKQLLRKVKAHLVRKGRCKQRLEEATTEITTAFRTVWNQNTVTI